ncbi:MAG: hypothetical protein VW405_14685 [Rhodospirillaceae bacterium]
MTVAINVDQPYASLIAHGIKEWETRPYPPAGWPGIPEGQRRMPGVRVEPGQEVLIVSNRSMAKGWACWLSAWNDDDADRLNLMESLGWTLDESANGDGWCKVWKPSVPLGAVVAVARITDVVPIDVVPYPHGMDRWVWAPPGRLDYCQLVYHEDYGGWGEHPADISDQLPYGDWTPGRWAWRLDDVRRLTEPVTEYRVEWDRSWTPPSTKPTPVRGRQGVWRPDPALVEAVERAS